MDRRVTRELMAEASPARDVGSDPTARFVVAEKTLGLGTVYGRREAR
jgi:hypothetical protein